MLQQRTLEGKNNKCKNIIYRDKIMLQGIKNKNVIKTRMYNTKSTIV